MSLMNLGKILDYLQRHPNTPHLASQIGEALGLSGLMVSARLFGAEHTTPHLECIRSHPHPSKWIWTKTELEESKQQDEEPELHILVDLGNVHDCVSLMEKQVKEGKARVRFFANMTYRGHPIKCQDSVCHDLVSQAQTPDKNSIYWMMAAYLVKADQDPHPKTVIIVSKADTMHCCVQNLLCHGGGSIRTVKFATCADSLSHHLT